MPFRIQRVPQGLNDLLSIFGGQTPIELEDRVRGSLELIQYYGLQQQQEIGVANGALAEGGTISATSNDTSVRSRFAVLFAASASLAKTATMTAARMRIIVARCGANGVTRAEKELGPFGATETGSTVVTYEPPYPLILRPPWDVSCFLAILGTDATASCSIRCEIGLFN
jgi:hypothetical protein